MDLIDTRLESAVAAGIITQDQANQLRSHFTYGTPSEPNTSFPFVVFYSGGLLVLAAMCWLLAATWSNGLAVTFIAALFASLLSIVGRIFWRSPNTQFMGGLLITLAVSLTPVLVYGFQQTFGWWPSRTGALTSNHLLDSQGRWFLMELGTVGAAWGALSMVSFPMLTIPLAVALWLMSIDLVPVLFGSLPLGFEEKKWVSCAFGGLMIVCSYFVDRVWRDLDYAFWTYLFGAISFWLAFSFLHRDTELSKLFYCLVNLGWIFLSVYLRRSIFFVLGTIGVLGYCGHIAWRVFNSYTFSLVLCLLGMLIIFVGYRFQVHQTKLANWVDAHLPRKLKELRPAPRASGTQSCRP